MADWRRFAEMLGAGAGAGIGGYQSAQGQNQDMLMQALQQAMQQKQFERQGQWHQQDTDYRNSQAEAANKRFIAQMIMGLHEGARQTMDRQTEADKRRAFEEKMLGKEYGLRTALAQIKGGGGGGAWPVQAPWSPEPSTINAMIKEALNSQYNAEGDMKKLPFNYWFGQLYNNVQNQVDPTNAPFFRGPFNAFSGGNVPQASSPKLKKQNIDFSKMSDEELMRFINE